MGVTWAGMAAQATSGMPASMQAAIRCAPMRSLVEATLTKKVGGEARAGPYDHPHGSAGLTGADQGAPAVGVTRGARAVRCVG